jgi:phosphoribosylformylglycinamidine synthase
MTSGTVGVRVQQEGTNPVHLFAESQSRFVVTVSPEHRTAFEAIVDAECIGEVTNENQLVVCDENGKAVLDLSQEEIVKAWKGAIPCLLK